MMIKKIFHKYVWRILGINRIIENQSLILHRQEVIKQNTDEILKAHLFVNTIADSSWLKYKNFSPGGWAVDYAFLYTLYRVLNGVKPKSIIEFGLGQSSKMVHQYANFYENVTATTYEHNKDWTSFFLLSLEQSYELRIRHVDIKHIEYKGKKTITYELENTEFDNKSFDLIIVDGPFGSDNFSRPQILDMIPNNINKSFCILFDDTHRIGELETVKEIYSILENNSIVYSSVQYGACKQHTLICSKNLGFLLSL